MKFVKTLFAAAIVGSTLLVSSHVFAAANTFSVTASIVGQGDTTTNKDNEASTAPKVKLDNAILYGMISNAVANAGTNGTGLAATNLPSNGTIAFNPTGTDGQVTGFFYVTNKSGFYFPLSGLDTNSSYYSFIELDAYSADLQDTVGSLALGFSGNFNGVETEKYNTSTSSGTVDVTSTALFYAHDNPYSFNGGDNAGAYYGNTEAFVINGVATIKTTYKNGVATAWDFSLKGTGNAVVDNDQNNIVTAGSVSIMVSTPVAKPQ